MLSTWRGPLHDHGQSMVQSGAGSQRSRRRGRAGVADQGFPNRIMALDGPQLGPNLGSQKGIVQPVSLFPSHVEQRENNGGL